MAWETRGDSLYYYRKKRIGNKVFSEYIGRGETALLIAQMDQRAKEEDKARKEAIKEEIAEIEALGQKGDQVNKLTKQLTEAIFLISGLHKHKGQWRRLKNVRK